MADDTPPTGVHKELAEAFPEDVTGYEETEDGQGVTRVDPYGIVPVVQDVLGRGHRILSLLSAYDEKEHFGVLYSFIRPSNVPQDFAEVRLRVVMPKKDEDGNDMEPECQSITPVCPAAGWQEREMYDMYGIRFDGHPDLRRMFLPEGWAGYPQRKDYKEPEQFIAMRDGEDVVFKEQEEGSW